MSKKEKQLPDFSHEIDSEQSWEEARRLGSIIGEIPNLFSTAIRFLMIDAERHNGILSPVSRYCLSRLTNGPTVNSALYLCAKNTYPEKIALGKRFQAAQSLHAADIASLISLLYLFRRLKAGCKREHFSAIEEVLLPRVEIASYIGAAIPSIGVGFAMLISASRLLGSSIFLGIDPARFEKYFRSYKRKSSFDQSLENKTWGCHHLQVSSIFHQRMGLGVAVAANIYAGLNTPSSKCNNLPDHLYTPFITELWIDTLLTKRAIPTITHRGQFYPVEQARNNLMNRVMRYLDNKNTISWLNIKSTDLSADSAPELFIEEKVLEDKDLEKVVKAELGQKEFKKIKDEKGSIL